MKSHVLRKRSLVLKDNWIALCYTTLLLIVHIFISRTPNYCCKYTMIIIVAYACHYYVYMYASEENIMSDMNMVHHTKYAF